MIAITRHTLSIFNRLEKLFPIVQFLIRLWVARVFWKAGMTKISNWDSTVALFANEYKVPLLSPEIAALMATAAELACPVLLVLGFGARFAAFALLVMTAVIEFTYMSFPIHQVWAIFLLVILVKGAGPLSVDNFLRKKLEK